LSSYHQYAKIRGVSPQSRSRSGDTASTDDVDELVTAVITATQVLGRVTARSVDALDESVTVPQFRALVVLSTSQPMNLNAFADRLGVTASTAMRMMDRLLVAGLATRDQNPVNRREVVLALTPEGSRLVKTATAHRRRQIADIVTLMPPDRRSELVAALHSFAAAAGEPEGNEAAED
jgi:DNA-binding MarR family transcriptional regulator